MEEKIAAMVQEKRTHSKAAQYSQTSAAKLAESAQDKVMKKAKLDNELAQARVESLVIQASIQDLETQLTEAVRELRQREELAGKYEVEIRRHNDEIQRKQYEVDRLNRKLEQLASKSQDENLGPLEATIHNLANEIAAKQRQCQELQGFWLRAQSELVSLQRQTAEQADVIRELAAKHAVLAQKQYRLNEAISQ
jgi:chromosome segregation ATPase